MRASGAGGRARQTSSSPWCLTPHASRTCCPATASPPACRRQDRGRHELISPVATKDPPPASMRSAGIPSTRRCRAARSALAATLTITGRRQRGGPSDKVKPMIRADGQEHHPGRRQTATDRSPRSPTRSSSRQHRGGGRGPAARRQTGADPAKVRQVLMGGGFCQLRIPRSARSAKAWSAHLRPRLSHRAAPEGPTSPPRAPGVPPNHRAQDFQRLQDAMAVRSGTTRCASERT